MDCSISNTGWINSIIVAMDRINSYREGGSVQQAPLLSADQLCSSTIVLTSSIAFGCRSKHERSFSCFAMLNVLHYHREALSQLWYMPLKQNSRGKTSSCIGTGLGAYKYVSAPPKNVDILHIILKLEVLKMGDWDPLGRCNFISRRS